MSSLGRRRIGFSRLVVIAVLAALAIINLRWALDGIAFDDFEAYWSAAMRLRAGADLYPSFSDINHVEVYRYSPWFAWLWVPLTYLPREVALVVWEGVLFAASGFILVRLIRLRAWLVLAFFGPLLLDSVMGANAQAVLVALLLWGVERRSGPIWIAVAVSLKAFPLAFALTYAGRRQWWRLLATVAMTAVLTAPFLFYELRYYTTDPGSSVLLWGTPLYWLLAGASVVAAIALARSRYGWLSAAAAVVLTLPRTWFYDLTFLLVGLSSIRPSGSPACTDAVSGSRASHSDG
jgi:Glycosyltransferase family 87